MLAKPAATVRRDGSSPGRGRFAKGNCHGSAVEEVLPITLFAHDDRNEQPQGVAPAIVEAGHPVLAGFADWPPFLGCNRATARPDATVLARFGDDPFIVVREPGRGRGPVFASDCGPHWGPPAFVDWAGYGRLWINLATWLSGPNGAA